MALGPAPDQEGPDAGFVLLSVLFAVTLFVAVSATYAIRARLLALQTRNLIDATAAQARADGAALFVADALRPQKPEAPDQQAIIAAALSGGAAPNAPLPVLPLPIDGTPVTCPQADGGSLALSAIDQGALIDLNGASVPMLRDVITAAGIDGETARRLADEIGDFRDPDDDPQENGIGERAQYAAKGLSWGPANRPFADIEELALLPSASSAIVSRLAPLVTVANPRAGLDLRMTPQASFGALSPKAVKRPEIARWQLASTSTDFAVLARLFRADGSLAAARRLTLSYGGRDRGEMRITRWIRPAPDGSAPVGSGGSDALCGALAKALPTSDGLRR